MELDEGMDGWKSGSSVKMMWWEDLGPTIPMIGVTFGLDEII
jgi:hypothetical protein